MYLAKNNLKIDKRRRRRRRREEEKNMNVIINSAHFYSLTTFFIHPSCLVRTSFTNNWKSQNCTYMHGTMNNEHQPGIEIFKPVPLHPMNYDAIEKCSGEKTRRIKLIFSLNIERNEEKSNEKKKRGGKLDFTMLRNWQGLKKMH